MSNFALLFFCVAGVISFWIYRRARAPDLLNEIYNGLKHIAFRESQRGDPVSAERYTKMADAIMDGQAYVHGKQIANLGHVKETARFVLHSMNYSVLEECGIYRQNHKHACYEATGNLTKQLSRIIERESKKA